MTPTPLRLYVTGHTQASQRAIASLLELCRRDFGGRYEVTIVDVLEHPEMAEADKVVATPMLIAQSADACQRLIGDRPDPDAITLRVIADVSAPGEAILLNPINVKEGEC